MKLIKKLLPVATLGSVAAVVVPLATSCTNGNAVSFDGLMPPDTTGWQVCEEDELNVLEAMDAYAEAIEQDNNVFYNDFCFGKGLQATLLAISNTTSTSSLTVNKYSGSVSNFALGENSSYSSMSYNADIDISTYWISNRTTNQVGELASVVKTKKELTTNIHCSIEVKNVPFLIYQTNVQSIQQKLTMFALPFCDFYDSSILSSFSDDWSLTVYAKGEAVEKSTSATGEETEARTAIDEWQTRNNKYWSDLSFQNYNLNQFSNFFVSSYVHYFVNTNIYGI